MRDTGFAAKMTPRSSADELAEKEAIKEAVKLSEKCIEDFLNIISPEIPKPIADLPDWRAEDFMGENLIYNKEHSTLQDSVRELAKLSLTIVTLSNQVVKKFIADKRGTDELRTNLNQNISPILLNNGMILTKISSGRVESISSKELGGALGNSVRAANALAQACGLTELVGEYLDHTRHEIAEGIQQAQIPKGRAF